ncbi:MAG: class I SAM-dependent methyltransferase [Gammaproteobacteria bacterium]|nr:class I SAM-dependent methyltransferase [Gammaproteobacteria bacterium]MCF6363106.1 class I SAM-dependent methyltransferase [Gammaproteobacteria bacterium]
MEGKLRQTQDMLARHHRDGAVFAQMMKDTFDDRFNETFWEMWGQHIEPALSDVPVILDLGTGPGMLLKVLAARYPKVRAIGVECADYMLEAAVELPEGCETIVADLHNPLLPLEDSTVDAAVASMVLHEMQQPVRALREVARCLKPGGCLYMLDWVRAPLKQYFDDTELDVFAADTPLEALEDLFIHFAEHNRFSADDLVFMLENTGFRVLEATALKDGRQVRIIAEKL